LQTPQLPNNRPTRLRKTDELGLGAKTYTGLYSYVKRNHNCIQCSISVDLDSLPRHNCR